MLELPALPANLLQTIDTTVFKAAGRCCRKSQRPPASCNATLPATPREKKLHRPK